MNDFVIDRNGFRNRCRRVAPTAVADSAGMVWTHSNPVELYRWILRRNALLSAIDVAFARTPPSLSGPLAG